MKKTIFVKGPVLSQSGYGEQSRFALRALRTVEDKYDILIHPINWGQSGWIWEDSEFRQWIDGRILATQAVARSGNFRPDITLQITIPNEFTKMSSVDIGFTAGIETTKVSPQWLEKGNEMDKLLVVSNHARNTYQSTNAIAEDQNGNRVPYSLKTPIEVVSQSTPRADAVPIDGFDLPYDSNFLVISQMGPRKNFLNTLRWFVEEFKDEEVGLVIKTSWKSNCRMDREHTDRQLANILKDYQDRKCKVHLLHGDLSAGQMTWLYNHSKINALINIAHGEGYGLPLFEAAREGLPVATIGWSGQLDFLHHNGKDYFEKVDYTLRQVQQEAVWKGVIEADSMWAYADEGSYKTALRKLLQDSESTKQRATELKAIIDNEFSDEKLYAAFCRSLESSIAQNPEEIKGISFCIPTNAAKVDKTLLTIKSIKEEMGDFPHEIILAGDIDAFKDVEGVTLVDKKDEAHSRKVSSLRNAAADNSSHDVIAWCDDDIVIGTRWLENTIEFSKNNSWDVLGNKLQNPDGTRHWDRATLKPHRLVDYDHNQYDKSLYQTAGFFLSRRKVFEAIRWDENCLVYGDKEGKLSEDVKFSLDLVRNGYRISFNESATAWHNDDRYTAFENRQNRTTLLKSKILEIIPTYSFATNHLRFDSLMEKLK